MDSPNIQWIDNPFADRMFMTIDQPPPQQTIFINPGDESNETYRLETFTDFPLYWINKEELSRNGHIYTGFRDRTQCHNCKIYMQNWQSFDKPSSTYLHLPSCKYTLKTLKTSPVKHTYQQLHGNQSQSSLSAYILNDPPVHPHHKSFIDRLHTFNQWQNSVVTPTQLAESGFFSAYESDKVICWYCNITLQQWSQNDNPDELHARLSPYCKFLIYKKGTTFIQTALLRLNAQFNTLRTLKSSNTSTSAHNTQDQTKNCTTDDSVNCNYLKSDANQSSQQHSDTQLQLDFTQSPLVASIHQQHFQNNKLISSLKRKIHVDNDNYSKCQKFIENLIQPSNSNQSPLKSISPEVSQKVILTPPISQPNTPQSSFTSSQSQFSNSSAEICKICNNNPITVIYLPCAHTISCNRCSFVGEACILCNKTITQIVQTLP